MSFNLIGFCKMVMKVIQLTSQVSAYSSCLPHQFIKLQQAFWSIVAMVSSALLILTYSQCLTSLDSKVMQLFEVITLDTGTILNFVI